MRCVSLFMMAALAACSGGGGSSSAAPAPPGVTPVSVIQGSGMASPLAGQRVMTEGVVTGDFQYGDADTSSDLGGFFILGTADGDAGTSDGLFVFDGDAPAVDVEAGQRVRIIGTVEEYYGETQLEAGAIEVIGTASAEPAPVVLPLATTTNGDGELIVDLEPFEGMLVTFPQTLTVSQLRNLERFGEMLLSADGRQFTYVNSSPPDPAGYAAHIDAVVSRRLILDDGRRDPNPGTALAVRNGDTITGLTGVVRYSRGSGRAGTETYRLMPTVDPVIAPANPRPPRPAVAGDLTIATVNLNNFFSTIDGGQPVCGPAAADDCRGADSAAELERQRAKLVTMLALLDADIVALVELENNAQASLKVLVDALNGAIGGDAYAFVDAGLIGRDAIKVGLIYRPGAVRPVGPFALLDRSVDARFDDGRNRPVLAQTFESEVNGERLTVLALHLKSKSSACDAGGDPDVGDGQGNCSATRSLAAAAIVDWIASDPTGSGDPDFVVIGDFNTYTYGDAMMQFEGAGFANVSADIIGNAAYSFEFDGRFGALDHAVVSAELVARVADAAEWHINVDEAPLRDYNLEFGRDPALFDPGNPYRASDHDPLIIGIELR